PISSSSLFTGILAGTARSEHLASLRSARRHGASLYHQLAGLARPPSFAAMDKNVDLGKDAANPSGAPEAGGATTPGSIFGGRTWWASGWRMLARFARDLEQVAY